MLSLLDRYISMQIIKGSLSSLILLLSLTLVFNLLAELSDVGKGDYNIINALVYVLLNLPYQAYQLFPSAIIIGSLWLLGDLASRREFIIWRSVGVSAKRMVVATWIGLILLILIYIILSEILIPMTSPKAALLKTQAKEESAYAGTGEKIWLRQGQDFIYIEEIVDPYHLKGVTIYRLNDKQQLVKTMVATQAKYHKEDKAWQLFQINWNQFNGMLIKADYNEHSVWDSKLSPEILRLLVIAPEFRNLITLAHYIHYLEINNLDSENYRLVFWQKVFSPLLFIVVLILLMPMIITQQAKTRLGLRLLAGILLGLILFLFIRVMGALGQVLNLPPMISAILPLFSLGVLGWIRLSKI